MTKKICSKCKKSLPLDNFYKQMHGDRVQYYYRSQCKKCYLEYNKKYMAIWTRGESKPRAKKSNTKKCTACGETKPLSQYYFARGYPYSRCKKCMEKINAVYKKSEIAKTMERNRYRKDVKKNPQKHKAWIEIGWLSRSGKINRQPCEVCGNPKSQAHHADYTKPAEVRWLCHQHHFDVHRELRR